MNVRFLPRKRALSTVLLVLLLSVVGMTKMYAYDFTAVAPNGQTLYYTITNSALYYARVVYPGTSNSNPWGNFTKPTGNLIIPGSVYNSNNSKYYIVVSIGDYAFYGCSGITELTIGEEITSVGDYSFWNCPSLTKVHFNAENCTEMYTYHSGASPYYFSVFNGGTTPTGTTAITELCIGNGVNRIPNYAFRNSPGLNQQLTIPSGVTYIGKEAFYHCSGLHGTLGIPNSVTSIGESAFNGCSNISNTLTLSSQLLTIGNSAFRDCGSLTGHVVIPNSVTSLGDYSFYGCTGITELTIGTGVTSVGDYSFWNCPVLTKVHFNAENCTEMYTYHSGASPYYFSVFNGGTTPTGTTAITELWIGNGVSRIPNYAFRNSVSLSQWSGIPNYVTYVGKEAFYHCSSLHGTLGIPNSVTSIGESAFNGCSNISNTLTLPSQLLTIGNSAFRDCGSLTGHVVIPNSVTSLGDYSFYGCTGITELTIGTGVTSVGDYSFWNCPVLTKVHFNAENCTEMYTYHSGASPYYFSVFNGGTTPTGTAAITDLWIGNGVNRIPNHAFRKSPGIIGVSFPQWLTNIGNNAFSDCENLASITLLSTTPPSVGSNAFSNVSLDIPVFVPCNYSGTYAASTGWSQFSNIIEVCSNQIVAVAYPANGGTVNGSGTYPAGYTCNLSATANPGYSFVHWRKNGEVVSNNTTYSFVVNGAGNYVAVFRENQSYNVTATTNPTNGGTVTGTGTYYQGQTCVLTASASAGYTFTNWTENGTVVSTNASYSFTVTGNRNLVANFTVNVVNCIINATVHPSYGGSVSGAGTYPLGQTCTLIASANPGYTFVGWTEGMSLASGGVIVSTNASYSFTVTGHWNVVANFESGITQTTNLSQGWNWFSTYLDITLDDLKAALLDALPNTSITIKSRTQNTAYAPNTNRWRGSLNALDVTQMYMIFVSNDCEITLTGMPINPAEHPVTINSGTNWIAFPFSESMTVSDAFAGFAVNGDKVKSRNNNSQYLRGSWKGQLTTLVPGLGYMYISNTQTPRTFTFPTSTTKSAHLGKKKTP